MTNINNRIYLAGAFVMAALLSYAQTEFLPELSQDLSITGPGVVVQGTQSHYEASWVQSTMPLPSEITFYQWMLGYPFPGGTILGSNIVGCDVSWTEKGSFWLEVEMFTEFDYHYNYSIIEVNSPLPGSPPPLNYYFTYPAGCGVKQVGIIEDNAVPAQGDIWYWQRTPDGTSTELGSGRSVLVNTEGPVYLRSRLVNAPYTWGEAQFAGQVWLTGTPGAPTIPIDGHIITDITSVPVQVPISFVRTSVSESYSYLWYAQPSGGTHLFSNSVNNIGYTPLVSGPQTDFYVETNLDGCKSTSRLKVSAYKHPLPVISVGNGGAVPTVLSVGNHIYETYQWYYNSDAIPGATSASYTANVAGNYYVRVGWGSATGKSTTVSTHVNPLPTPPIANAGPDLTIHLDNGPVTITGSATAGNGGITSWTWHKLSGPAVTMSNANTASLVLTNYSLGQYMFRLTATDALGYQSTDDVSLAVITSDNYNYIRETVLLVNCSSEEEVASLPVTQLSVTYNYFDGLGRPIQSISQQNSPLKMDIVQPIAYDALGRETIKYLPYVSVSAEGKYQRTALEDQLQFYSNGLADKVIDDARPFAESKLEASPLNRILKQGAPGEAWQPNSNTADYSDRTIKKEYTSNDTNEVLLWTYNSSTHRVTAKNGGALVYYAANELAVTKTYDEHNKISIEYIDKEGRAVLKRVQALAPTPVNDTNYASTYYIYDDLGNLVTVISPEGVSKLAALYHTASASLQETFLIQWAFRYKYDSRKRIIEKWIPGSDGPVRMAYDKRDRLVLTQDANQRGTTPRYLTFNKYDELNRPIITGIKDTTVNLTQAQMQAIVDAHYSKSWARYGETYIGNAGGNIHGYSNRSFPVTTTVTAPFINPNHYLTITYYDRYSFKNDWPDDYNYTYEALAATSGGAFYRQPQGESLSVIGQITGTLIKVLNGGVRGSKTFLKTVNYYDDKYRLIQSISDNYSGGKDRLTNLYDFTGKVLQSKTSHYNLWRNQAGVEVSADRIERMLSSSGWNAGAASCNSLAPGQDGWLEVKLIQTTKERVIGLSSHNSDAGYTNIDYAFHLTATGSLVIKENGTTKANKGVFAVGDILKIERTGTTVKYYKNNFIQHTSTTPSTTRLFIDASIFHFEGAFADIHTSISPAVKTISRRFEYDHAGRLINVWHRLDSEPEVLLFKNEYNELGQLIDKKLHSTVSNASNAKQSVDYRYNIRGWLSQMNEDDLAQGDPGDPRDLFSMKLGYDKNIGMSNPSFYNGNISAMTWSTNLGLSNIKKNGYVYDYDPLNRLTGATFKGNAATWSIPMDSAFSDYGYQYDLNGNIKALKRRGSGGATIDRLTYDYGTGTTQSNRLLAVTDSGDKNKGFTEVVTSSDYVYDANGNLKLDRNKGITAITYNYLNLPETVTGSGGDQLKYIYDATGRKLRQEVLTSAGVLKKKTDYAGEFFYENDTLKFINHEEGRIVMTGSTPEYQYHLKDHLGNVRMTFTTKEETESATATLEPSNFSAEHAAFLRTGTARKIRSALFDHTNGNSLGYSERLNGTANEKFGIAKSISVMPGDTVNMEVYAKYVDPNNTNVTQALADFLAAIASGTAPAGTIVDGAGYAASTSSFNYAGLLNTSGSSGNGPKAYLNWLIFDRDYYFVNGGYQRMSDLAKEQGQNITHERLSATVPITQPGYMYIYLSNEEPNPVEVFFDDFKVEHVKSPVVQLDDYYPFGLAYNSYSRENSISNQYKYNGKELQNELNLGWLDYGARMYQPELGRFFAQDRFAEKYFDLNSYQYAANNPLINVDINGDSIKTVFYDKNGKQLNSVPAIVQQMFNDEFGIKVGYNAKTGMLYFEGNYDSELSQSETATTLLTDKLKDTNSGFEHGQIVFGYGLSHRAGSVDQGAADRWGGEGAPGIFNKVSIDLNDFNQDGTYKRWKYNGMSARDENMARVFEHEYLGHHQINKMASGDGSLNRMGKVVEYTNLFRRERSLKERLNYGRRTIVYGSTSDFNSKKELIKYIRSINYGRNTPKSYMQK